jgi:hypothetical protein
MANASVLIKIPVPPDVQRSTASAAVATCAQHPQCQGAKKAVPVVVPATQWLFVQLCSYSTVQPPHACDSNAGRQIGAGAGIERQDHEATT